MRYISMLLSLFCCLLVQADQPPALTLANLYQTQLELADYWVSEKYDGVRAYWDGQRLVSRQGKPIIASAEFLQQLPAIAVEGELWFGRNQFERASGLVQRHQTHPLFKTEWQQVKFMLFDAPQTPGSFAERYAQLQSVVNERTVNLEVAPQWSVNSEAQLLLMLEEYSDAGAEGLMLRNIAAPYKGGRSNDLVKLKRWQDQEAEVIAHLPGKGKYHGMLGALRVRLESGQEIKIGTGFSDAERASPPELGAIISFKYQGETRYGIPRFPVYWRLRVEE